MSSIEKDEVGFRRTVSRLIDPKESLDGCPWSALLLSVELLHAKPSRWRACPGRARGWSPSRAALRSTPSSRLRC